MFSKSNFSYLFLLIILFSCNNTQTHHGEDNVNNANAIPAPANLQYKVIRVHTHDTSSYTEGLEWHGDSLIESTGNYKQSKLIVLDSNMKTLRAPIKLDAAYFGEGTTLFKGKIYQLTWKEHMVFVYDAKTLKKLNELYWPYEGWGMTHDDTAIIVNTGGSNLYYVNPLNFSVIKTLGVFNNFGYVSNINELEYVAGKLFANVYMTDNIIQIDPISGRVIGNLDLTNILSVVGVKNDPRIKDPGNVLNGIAYNKARGSFYITGKDWPVLIEMKIK